MADEVSGYPVFDGQQWHFDAVLRHENGKVLEIDSPEPPTSTSNDAHLQGGFIMPGLVDLQVNGGGGVMFNDTTSVDGIETICAAHAALGTTSLLPTLITDENEVRKAAIQSAIDATGSVPGCAGLHLEGPHLDPQRSGAHEPELIRVADVADINLLKSASRQLSTLMMTFAPEALALSQVRELLDAGLHLSIGHTNCSFETARDYAESGVRLATHLFNAMSPFGHRSPGMVGATLELGSLSGGLIADGFHVHPAAITMVLRTKQKPGQIFLVSDAMSTVGSSLQSFKLNGRTIYRSKGRLTLEDGTLAGADIALLDAIKFIHLQMGLPLEIAAKMATSIPASRIGRSDIGHLAEGTNADFLVLGPDLTLREVYRGGKLLRA